jgi:hypothetical protein
MCQARQETRGRKIGEMETLVAALRARIGELEKHRGARELSLLEDGLRLSQENEALRMELAALQKYRK